jgi:hypothetical protein
MTMTFPGDQVKELAMIFPGTQYGEEGGVGYFQIPDLSLPPGRIPPSCDALLCPSGRDGYASRLFLAQSIATPAGLNWNASNVRVFERNWFAVSWRVRDGLRLVQMISAHLDAFR